MALTFLWLSNRNIVNSSAPLNAGDKALIPISKLLPEDRAGMRPKLQGSTTHVEKQSNGSEENSASANVWEDFQHNLNRSIAAVELIEAVLDCAPRDRVLFLETILDQIRPGWPRSFNIDVMQEASWWADTATRPELKAYALTCYRRLSRDDKQAFLTYITGAKA